jgi:heme A synthase
MSRFFAYFFGVVAFILVIFTFKELQLVGFPDGFLSDWDRLRKIILILFIALSIPIGVWFFFLGKIATKEIISTKLYLTVILYIVIIFILFTANNHLSELSGIGG